MKKYALLAILGLSSASAAYGQAGAAYYGVALGSFDYGEDATPGFSAISDTVSSYRLMVGYQFSDHLGVEGGWGKTGTIRDTVTFSGGGGPSTLGFASEFQILTIRLLGVLNLDNGVTLLGGVGYADMTQDIDIDIPGIGVSSGDTSGGETTLYAGVQYDWDRAAVRLAYEKYNFGGGVNVAESSLTIFYKL
jgi:hypothetical protein